MITDDMLKAAIAAYEYQFGTRNTQIKNALEAAYPLIRQQVLKEVNDALQKAKSTAFTPDTNHGIRVAKFIVSLMIDNKA